MSLTQLRLMLLSEALHSESPFITAKSTTQRLDKLLDEENELKRSLSSLNKKINTCKDNIVNINEQMEALSKKLKAMTAEEPTLTEEDEKQTAYYEAASELFYNQREIDTTNALLSMEHTRVDSSQETLDALGAAISNDFDTGWARATKFLKGERPEKIATIVCLEYTSESFHVNIGEYKENEKDMEKLKLSLLGLQNNCNVIQEKSRGIDQILKDLGVRINNRKELLTSLSLIFRNIKKKFPNLDPNPDKAKAAQISAREKLERFRNKKSTLLMDILALKNRYIEEHKTKTDLTVSVKYRECRLQAFDSHMKSLVATDPRIAQERFMFGKRNSLYDFEKDNPATALKRATGERKFNGVAVMTDIDEIYARASKEESDFTSELKKIKGEISACEHTTTKNLF
nr:hypothetical protein [Tanacetum cinerariifolium]